MPPRLFEGLEARGKDAWLGREHLAVGFQANLTRLWTSQTPGTEGEGKESWMSGAIGGLRLKPRIAKTNICSCSWPQAFRFGRALPQELSPTAATGVTLLHRS